jgi:hypothetical protein
VLCSDRLGIIEVEFMAAQEFKIGCVEIKETSSASTTSAFNDMQKIIEFAPDTFFNKHHET